MYTAAMNAMRELHEATKGHIQVKIVLDRAGTAAAREHRYEVQVYIGTACPIRTTGLTWASAKETASFESKRHLPRKHEV